MRTPAAEDPRQRARNRRLALALGLVALGFYAGFILLGVIGGRG